MCHLLALLGHTGRRIVKIKYTHTNDADELFLKKGSVRDFHKVFRKFTSLCWAAFKAVLGCVRLIGHGVAQVCFSTFVMT